MCSYRNNTERSHVPIAQVRLKVTSCTSIVIYFALKSILPDTLYCFILFNVCILYFFLPFQFLFDVSLYLKLVAYRQHRVGRCFLITSANLCLLISVLRPITFNIIIYMFRFQSAILNFGLFVLFPSTTSPPSCLLFPAFLQVI